MIVSAIPTCLGGALAYAHGSFDLVLFLLVLGGVLMAQSAADFIDDYCDYYAQNFGNKDQQFHDSPLLSGRITPRQVLIAGLVCTAVAGGIGVYLLILEHLQLPSEPPRPALARPPPQTEMDC